MDQVEARARETGRRGVALHHTDVGQRTLLDDLASELDELRLQVKPEDLALRTDLLSQQVEDAQRTTAEIHRPPARTNAEAIEQPACLGCEVLRLFEQTLLLLRRDAEHVRIAGCAGWNGHTAPPKSAEGGCDPMTSSGCGRSASYATGQSL
jgi:hypothetical protein